MTEESILDRKMTMHLARAGFGIHPDRYILLYDIGSRTETPDEQFIEDIAIIHYEADIVISSSAEEIIETMTLKEDNIYFVPAITAELKSFIESKATVILAPERIEASDKATLKNEIIENMKRDDFKRDDESKVFIYRIATNPKGYI